MTWPHSPWPLFCNDLNQARSWVKPQLQGAVSDRTGHLAISLGLGVELLDGVRSGALHADPMSIGQWRFRLARLRRDANPYQQLLPEGLFDQILIALANAKSGKETLEVELNGGIGDHLEALSLILPWAKTFNVNLKLVMSKERQQQIEPLIPNYEKISCITRNKCKSNPIPVMALRAGLVEENLPANYGAWAPKLPDKRRDRNHYLCCWRAEGVGDKFSAHSRSIPWKMAYNFYQNLIINQSRNHILDITYWAKWERKQFEKMGVTIVDPRKVSLIGLIKQCQISRVITIDTALAHLCAASGIEADLLLCLFPDERWQELHKPENNYGQFLKLRRSSHFGDWSDVLSSLIASLTSED